MRNLYRSTGRGWQEKGLENMHHQVSDNKPMYASGVRQGVTSSLFLPLE